MRVGGTSVSICKAETSSNKPCRARAVSGSRFCFFHDPKLRQFRHNAQAKGGRKPSSATEQSPCSSYVRPYEFRRHLQLHSLAVNGLLQGWLDARDCHAIAHVVESQIRAYHAGALAEAVERLERRWRDRASRAAFRSTTSSPAHPVEQEQRESQDNDQGPDSRAA